MKWMKKKFKRSLAMFLTVCMILTSFQGVAFADLDSTAEDRDILIELDGATLKAEAEAAIRSGKLYNAQLGFQELELAESSDGEEKVKLVDSDAYSDIFDQSTGSIYMLKNVPYINKASASDAMHKDAELQVFVKLNGQAAEAASGSSALKASDSNLRKASASDIIVDTQNYQMKGDEKIIFLFINRSEADLTFQLDIDGKKSALVLVESKSVLLSEGEKEKEELPPIIPEIPAGGEAIEGGDTAGPGGSSGGSESGSGSGITEDNGDNDTTIEDGNQGPEEDSGDTTGDSTPSTGDEGQTGTGEGNDSETENNGGGDSAPTEGETQTKPEDGQDENGSGGSQNQEGQGNESQTGGQENQGGNGGRAEDNGSSDNGNTDSGNSSESGSGTTDNGSAGNVTTGDSSSDSGSEGSGSTDSGSAGSSSTDSGLAGSDATDSGSEGSSSTDSGSSGSGGDVQVSISSHRVDRVMAFVPQDSYDDDDDDAPKSPEEEFEMMYGDDAEEEEADEEQYNDDVEVYSSDTNGVDIPTEVYPVVLVKNKKRALLRMARSSAKQADASAGMMIMSLGDLQTMAAGSFMPVVDLYDYYDMKYGNNISKNNDDVGFNGAILSNYRADGISENELKQSFSLYADGSRSNLLRSGQAWQFNNLVQKLAVSTYEDESHRAQVKKYFGPHTTMFPVDESYIRDEYEVYKLHEDAFNEGIRWYPNVSFPGFSSKSVSGGYTKYVFDASKTPVRRDSSEKNTLKLKKTSGSSNGFWPFNTESYPSDTAKKYSFGMHMSIPFFLPSNGCFDENGRVPLTFEFRGDDDVWVYLKDSEGVSRLVLDLGGMHVSSTGTIDFKSGATSVSGNVNKYELNEKGNNVQIGGSGTILRDNIYNIEGIEKGQFYTLEFFYMERNPTESNCYIEIGLPVPPEGTLQIAKAVKGISQEEAASKNYTFEVQESENGEDWTPVKKISIKAGTYDRSITTTSTKWYRIREVNPNDGSTASWSGDGNIESDWYVVKVEPNSGKQIVCTNEYAANSLQITKKMTGNSLPENLAANFKVTIKDSDGKRIKISTPAGQRNVTINSNNYEISDIALKDNEMCTISGLDDASKYQVEETGISDTAYDYSVAISSSGDDGSVSINPGEKKAEGGFPVKEQGSSQVNLTFTNTVELKTGGFTVTKKVTGEVPEGNPDYVFYLTLKDTEGRNVKDNLPGSIEHQGKIEWDTGEMAFRFTLKKDETLTVTGVPEGYSYVLREAESDSADSAIVNISVTIDGKPGSNTNGEIAEQTIRYNESKKIVYRNKMGDIRVLTLTKVPEGSDLPAENQTYEFELMRKTEEGWEEFQDFTGGSAEQDNRIIIKGAGSVKLNIHPKYANDIFKFIETAEGDINSDETLWKVGAKGKTSDSNKESPEFTLSEKAELEVKCYNSYVNRTLTIEKKLAESSADITGKFEFETVFTDKNKEILLVPYMITRKATGGEESGRLSEGNKTFELAPGDQIVFSKIPNGASYQITETGGNTIPAQYEVKCTGAVVERVDKDNVKTQLASSANATMTYDFAEEINKNQAVTFTNLVTVKSGILRISKMIVADSEADSLVSADHDLTFTFKVTNTDTKETFYASVTVNANSSAASKDIKVPVGSYVIEEIPYLQYIAVDDTKEASVVPGTEPGADAKVEFHNYKSGEGYFTDVKVKVNTVDEGGFPTENNSIPKREALPLAVLFTGSSKAEEDDSNEN